MQIISKIITNVLTALYQPFWFSIILSVLFMFVYKRYSSVKQAAKECISWFNGGVTRGVCKVAKGHTHITDVVETSNIVKTVTDGYIGAEADDVELDPESYVSMNFWGFPAKEGCAPVKWP